MSDPPIALVIGYGNSLRGDDGVGPIAADEIRGWALAGVTVISTVQLTPELAEPISSARQVVFVDARIRVEQGAPDVEICRLEPAESGAISQGHSGDPRKLLALARDVFGSHPPAWLVTVASSNFGLGEGLSPRASRGLGAALRRIALLLSPEMESTGAAGSLASSNQGPGTDPAPLHEEE